MSHSSFPALINDQYEINQITQSYTAGTIV